MSKKLSSCSNKKQQSTTDAATHLILLYVNNPCLYRVKSNEYHNRNLRHKAYNEITEAINTLYPDMQINEAMIKNKLHTLRTQYTNEVNKIKKSEASGVSPDDVYTPTLWCFELLRFLEDTEVIIPGESNLNVVPEMQSEGEVIYHGTVEDISVHLSPSRSPAEEEIEERPPSVSSSSKSTPIRPHSSQSEEPVIYKNRETPSLKKRKHEDVQLTKLLDNATKAISLISEEPNKTDDTDIDHFIRYIGKEMEKINDDEILDDFKENVMLQLTAAKRRCRQMSSTAGT